MHKEEFELGTSGNGLGFEETNSESFVLFENADWRVTSVRFFDKANVLQLGGGRIFIAGSGAEVARHLRKANQAQRNYLDWADMYVGIADGNYGEEPPAEDLSQWASSLGLNGEEALPGAKPFADGLPNLLRYSMNLGRSPTPDELPVTKVSEVDGKPCLIFEFQMRKVMSNVELVAVASDELLEEGWDPVPSQFVTRLESVNLTTDRYRVTLPISDPRKFIRLRATEK